MSKKATEVTSEIKYYRLALLSAKNRDLSQAVEYLYCSLAQNGQNQQARKLLGLCLYELGELKDASKQFENLADETDLKNDTDKLIAYENSALERVKNLARQKKWLKAEKEAREIPCQNVRMLNLRGILYALAGRYTKAERLFAQAIEKDRGNRLASTCLIEAVKRRKNFWPFGG